MIVLAPGAPTRPSDILALLDKGDVAALIWRGPPDPQTVEAVQQRDVAVILDGAPHQAAAAGLDGAHVSGLEALKPALSAMKPDGIVGVGGLANRHDAMTAGESGADYVLFGDLDGDPGDFPRTRDLAGWWAELFEVPCVAVAGSLDAVDVLARAGVDFIALAGALVSGPQAAAHVAEAQARIVASHSDEAAR